MVQFEVALRDAGGIEAINNSIAIIIAPTLDFGGVAYTGPTRNSVFLIEEHNPRIHEVNPATGAALPAVIMLSLFNATKTRARISTTDLLDRHMRM